ncbi:MAG: 30S ribosomal protein S9 [Phycisphaeraceae bacterium]|nr:MAG: 30S ribosomal protein S9 [Phycisphaeraceae bacterium]
MSTITNPNIAGLSTVASPAAPAPVERPLRTAVPADKHGWWWGTGRRKTAIARCRMKAAKEGQGTVKVQVTDKRFKAIEEYFCEFRDRADATSPLTVTKTTGKFDIVLRMSGGGFMGQAQAARLAIARALRDYDPTLEGALREHGMLTRDAREVERKKYGLAGARRRFQFSKR